MWLAVVHRGGRVRGVSHIMPAFEDVLTDAEIDRVVQYLALVLRGAAGGRAAT